MREILLLAIGVFAFAAAAFVPGGAIDSATDVARDPANSDASVLHTGTTQMASDRTDQLARWSAGTVELPRAADGHFYAQANVNGAPVGFLVDTGASTIALTAADAEAIGVYWSLGDVRVVAQGASGPVRGVTITLDHIELGGHTARNVQAVVIPEGLSISLLGQSFLSTIDSVRIEKDRMTLGS